MDNHNSGSNPGSDEDHSFSEPETDSPVDSPRKPINTSNGALRLRSWLNKTLKIRMTDGRTLVGVFLCTDRDANVILGSCSEYLPPDSTVFNEDTRMLGLVMIPGKHIITVHIDMNEFPHEGRPQVSEAFDYL
ncbi:N-alpha-acetyltransferase 38, NatC auxiliary subunit [Sitophilus oryzae]|uniref:N-alpha-acetyltransferase 38, NatC auxiliary subunit n=1 Tax=Sitophilus oryzae TaxID=7048 RepID=A0A6J2XHN2_SITOR|nr:N-alpha-acetyltransferase 38, NatC auxiliary subunit [Sitophilus oryzae]